MLLSINEKYVQHHPCLLKVNLDENNAQNNNNLFDNMTNLSNLGIKCTIFNRNSVKNSEIFNGKNEENTEFLLNDFLCSLKHRPKARTSKSKKIKSKEDQKLKYFFKNLKVLLSVKSVIKYGEKGRKAKSNNLIYKHTKNLIHQIYNIFVNMNIYEKFMNQMK